VLDTHEGRRLIWAVLCKCGIYSTTATGNAWGMYNEGRRSVGLMLLRDTQITPKLFLQMQNEHANIDDFDIKQKDGKPDDMEFLGQD